MIFKNSFLFFKKKARALYLNSNIYNNKIYSSLDEKFDIIFLDPPYKYKNLENILININNEKLLDKNGVIIIHRHKNKKDIFPKNFKIIEEKKYGISKIIFLSRDKDI